MKASDKAEIAALNHAVDVDRAAKRRLDDSDWHYLAFYTEHTEIQMRCPDRQHAVLLTPAEALSTGCRTCALMDGPTQTVSLARLKKDVDKQDEEHYRAIKKTRNKMRGAAGAERYVATI